MRHFTLAAGKSDCNGFVWNYFVKWRMFVSIEKVSVLQVCIIDAEKYIFEAELI